MSKSSFAAIAAVASAAFAVACGDLPSGTDGLPSFAAAGNSGCYTVKGVMNQTGVPPTFTGTTSGDLQGTAATNASLDPPKYAGEVILSSGPSAYEISGGSVGPLIGQTLLTFTESRVVFSQDNPAVGRINGTETVQSPGTGHLTVHGTLDFTNYPNTVVSVRYNGVVCP